jgi:hypothetical protein
MDLAKIIEDLLEDKARIERVIAALEDLQRNAVEIPELPNSRKKGRKPMPPEERREVSARMKRYWVRFRSERTMGGSAGSDGGSQSRS